VHELINFLTSFWVVLVRRGVFLWSMSENLVIELRFVKLRYWCVDRLLLEFLEFLSANMFFYLFEEVFDAILCLCRGMKSL